MLVYIYVVVYVFVLFPAFRKYLGAFSSRSLSVFLSFSNLLIPSVFMCVCVLWILSESVATSEACATFINLTKKAGGRFFSHFIKFLVWSFGSNLWSPLGSFNMMLHISFKRLLHIVDGIQNFILFLASFM